VGGDGGAGDFHPTHRTKREAWGTREFWLGRQAVSLPLDAHVSETRHGAPAIKGRVQLFAAFDAVVVIGVAGGAEGLVVEADGADGLVELLGEGVEGAEVVGAGRNLEVGGVEELLVTLVEEVRDLAVEQEAGASDHEDGALVRRLAGRGFGDLGGAAVLTDPQGAGGTSGHGG
jgi:hypothetical protein